MATVLWFPNSVVTAQVDQLQGGGTPAAGNVITATVGASATSAGKAVSYTLTASDTIATAISTLQAALAAAGPAIPEFSEITFAVSAASANNLNCTASVPGTPFTLSAGPTSGPGMTLTRVPVIANSSPSDVANPANYLRNGVQTLPQNGDTLVAAATGVPMLWNLGALAAVQLADYQRYQSMQGQIGLPRVNPLGYFEYRPTRLQLNKTSSSSPSGSPGPSALTAELGLGNTGSGPPLERYDFGAAQCAWTVLDSGSPSGDFAVDILNTSPLSALTLVKTSVGWAYYPGEVGNLSTATVDGGASLSLGAGVSMSGTLTVTQGSAFLQCAPGAVLLQQGSQLTVGSIGLNYPSITLRDGSTLTWLSNSGILNILMSDGSTLDKSQDVRPMAIAGGQMDGDCVIIDPHNAISYAAPGLLVATPAQSGPFLFSAGRKVYVQ